MAQAGRVKPGGRSDKGFDFWRYVMSRYLLILPIFVIGVSASFFLLARAYFLRTWESQSIGIAGGIEADFQEISPGLGLLPDPHEIGPIVDRHLGRFRIQRINVIDPGGRVVYSTAPDVTGVVFKENRKLDFALSGRAVSDVERARDEPDVPWDRRDGDWLETYIPIRSSGGNGKVVGAFEIYQDVEEMYGMLRFFGWSVAVGSLLVIGFLLVVVTLPVRGARALAEESAALAAQLQEVREERMKDLERKMAESARLAITGEIAAVLVHEIRNSASSARLLVENGLKGNGGGPLAAQDGRIIVHSLQQMERASAHLLHFARPNPPRFARVDLGDLLREAGQTVRAHAEQKEVRLVVQFPPVPVYAQADAAMVVQAVVNLLLNAVQASQAGKSVRVELDGAEPMAEVRVTDEGEGISPSHLNRIFQPFFTTKDAGTGLGLSVTRRIAQDHGGSVTVESILGRGTTVRMFLRADLTA